MGKWDKVASGSKRAALGRLVSARLAQTTCGSARLWLALPFISRAWRQVSGADLASWIRTAWGVLKEWELRSPSVSKAWAAAAVCMAAGLWSCRALVAFDSHSLWEDSCKIQCVSDF